jgi:hypothetical protein
MHYHNKAASSTGPCRQRFQLGRADIAALAWLDLDRRLGGFRFALELPLSALKRQIEFQLRDQLVDRERPLRVRDATLLRIMDVSM